VRDTHIRNSNSRNNSAALEIPEAESVGLLDTSSGLQNRQRDNKVRGEKDVLLKVNAETVRRELLPKDVEGAVNIFGPLVDNVALRVSLNEAAGGSTNGTTHIGDEETTAIMLVRKSKRP
jgi:hypothetical protein